MGINANVAFNISVRTVINKRGIPFPVESSEKKQAETLDAMAETKRISKDFDKVSVFAQPSTKNDSLTTVMLT